MRQSEIYVPESFGKWEILKEIKPTRAYLVEKNSRTGVAKIIRSISTEISQLKMLDHPNIVRLLDYSIEAPVPYLITEYHDKGDVSREKLSSLSTGEKVQFVKQMIDVTEYCNSQGVPIDGHGTYGFVISDDYQPVMIDFENPLVKPESNPLSGSTELQLAGEILGIDWVLQQLG